MGTAPGVDYSTARTIASFATAPTKVTGPGTTTVVPVIADTGLSGQTTAFRVRQGTASSQTVFEGTMATPVSLVDSFARIAYRRPGYSEVYPGQDSAAVGAPLLAPKDDIRWIEVTLAESKAAYTAGNHVTHRVATGTTTGIGSWWTWGSLDPDWVTETGTPNLASIGYWRWSIDAFRTSNGPVVIDFGRIEIIPRVANRAKVVIGIDDSIDAAHQTFFPILAANGMTATAYPGSLSTWGSTQNTRAQELVAAGWSIGVHAYAGHVTPTVEELRVNLDASIAKHEALGLVGTEDFAHWGPGTGNTGLGRSTANMTEIAARFRSGRLTANSPGKPETLPLTNQYLSLCWLIGSPTTTGNTLADLQAFVNEAIAGKGLAEFCFHSDPTSIFDEFIAWLKVQQDAGLLDVVSRAEALGQVEETPGPRDWAGRYDAPPEVITGNVTLTQGQVFENKTVYGRITVPSTVDGVTIRDVDVILPETTTVNSLGIAFNKADALNNRVEHVRVSVPTSNRSYHWSAGIGGRGFVADWVDISGTVDGIKAHGVANAAQRTGVLDHSLIHDLFHDPADPQQTDGSHGDGVQVGGNIDMTIRNTVIYGGHTSCIITTANVAGSTSLTVEDVELHGHPTSGSTLNIASPLASQSIRRIKVDRASKSPRLLATDTGSRVATEWGFVSGTTGSPAGWVAGPDSPRYIDDGTVVPVTNG